MKPITHYSFGTMTIAGEEICGDLFIHPDGRIRKNWWRAEGHRSQMRYIGFRQGRTRLTDQCR